VYYDGLLGREQNIPDYCYQAYTSDKQAVYTNEVRDKGTGYNANEAEHVKERGKAI
jgi:hypothetical protein